MAADGSEWRQQSLEGIFLPRHPVAQRCFQVALSRAEDVVSRTAEALKIIPCVAAGVHTHGFGARRVITVNGGS